MLEILRATLEEAGLQGPDLDQVLNGVRQREHLIVAHRLTNPRLAVVGLIAALAQRGGGAGRTGKSCRGASERAVRRVVRDWRHPG